MGVYSKSYSSMEGNNSGNNSSLIEACVYLEEMDQKMFDTLIEFDFLSAKNLKTMNESEAVSINEAVNTEKIKGILKQVKTVVDTIIEKIKQAISDFSKKVSELIDIDKRLLDKYKKVLTTDNLKGFKGISNFAMPKTDVDFGKDIDDVSNDLFNFLKKMVNVTSKDQVDDISTEFDKYYKESMKTTMKNVREAYFQKPVDNFIPSSKDIKVFIDTLSDSKKSVKSLKEAALKSIKFLNSLKAINVRDDEVGLAACAASKTMIFKASKLNLKYVSMIINVKKKQIGACRKGFLICGRYALKHSKGESESVEESFTNNLVEYTLMEASDAFVYDLFD